MVFILRVNQKLAGSTSSNPFKPFNQLLVAIYEIFKFITESYLLFVHYVVYISRKLYI